MEYIVKFDSEALQRIKSHSISNKEIDVKNCAKEIREVLDKYDCELEVKNLDLYFNVWVAKRCDQSDPLCYREILQGMIKEEL